MGVIYSTLRLANPYYPEQDEITVEAWVDTGATHLCIPEHIALQLKMMPDGSVFSTVGWA